MANGTRNNDDKIFFLAFSLISARVFIIPIVSSSLRISRNFIYLQIFIFILIRTSKGVLFVLWQVVLFKYVGYLQHICAIVDPTKWPSWSFSPSSIVDPKETGVYDGRFGQYRDQNRMYYLDLSISPRRGGCWEYDRKFVFCTVIFIMFGGESRTSIINYPGLVSEIQLFKFQLLQGILRKCGLHGLQPNELHKDIDNRENMIIILFCNRSIKGIWSVLKM